MKEYKQISGELVWKAKNEKGIPLDLIFEMMAEKSMVPNWHQLIQCAKKGGVNLPRFIKNLQGLVKNAYEFDIPDEEIRKATLIHLEINS